MERIPEKHETGQGLLRTSLRGESLLAWAREGLRRLRSRLAGTNPGRASRQAIRVVLLLSMVGGLGALAAREWLPGRLVARLPQQPATRGLSPAELLEDSLGAATFRQRLPRLQLPADEGEVGAASSATHPASGSAQPAPRSPARPAGAAAAARDSRPARIPAAGRAAPAPGEEAAPATALPALNLAELTLPAQGEVLRGYGWQQLDGLRLWKLHGGVDIAARPGEAVRAAWGGRVAQVYREPGEGTMVVVEHAGGWATVYGGLAASAVAPGARVERGALLGTVARPQAGQPHVHFGLRRHGEPVDPDQFLR